MKAILTIALALAAAGGGYAYFGNSGILPCCPGEGDTAIAVTTVSDTAKADGCCDVKVDCADVVCDPVACEPTGCDETKAGEYAMVQGGVLASPADAAACSSAKTECSEAKMECTEAKSECTEMKSCDSMPSLD